MGGATMKRLAATALSLALLALGCDRPGREGAAPGAGTSPAVIGSTSGAAAEDTKVPFVRIAELEIDTAQLEGYKAAVKEEMETSVRVEPGVLAIYAVAEKDNPSRLRFFEMYADEAAYNAHRESAHFKKYANTTRDMITSRRLIETVPVQMSAKGK